MSARESELCEHAKGRPDAQGGQPRDRRQLRGAQPSKADASPLPDRPAEKHHDCDEDRGAECGPSDEAPAPETSAIELDPPLYRDDHAASESILLRTRASSPTCPPIL